MRGGGRKGADDKQRMNCPPPRWIAPPSALWLGPSLAAPLRGPGRHAPRPAPPLGLFRPAGAPLFPAAVFCSGRRTGPPARARRRSPAPSKPPGPSVCRPRRPVPCCTEPPQPGPCPPRPNTARGAPASPARVAAGARPSPLPRPRPREHPALPVPNPLRAPRPRRGRWPRARAPAWPRPLPAHLPPCLALRTVAPLGRRRGCRSDPPSVLFLRLPSALKAAANGP
jgi:hypothetical protein